MTSQERQKGTSSSLLQMLTRTQRWNDQKNKKKNENIMISDIKKGQRLNALWPLFDTTAHLTGPREHMTAMQ